jgi:CheY-like chemotaxis protein
METSMNNNGVIILMADDDADDRVMTKDAFEENLIRNPLHFVEDGEELLEYLYRRGKYSHLQDLALPGLILLDLNMPRKDGRQVLEEIKKEKRFRHIPVVILTTSKQEEDILRTYQLGCSGFITKPVRFEGLINIVRSLRQYWIEIVEVPGRNGHTSPNM